MLSSFDLLVKGEYTCFPKFNYDFLFILLEEVAGKSLFVQSQVAPPSGRRKDQN